MAHTCEALIAICIDFRLQKYVRKWTDDNLGDHEFDLVGFAGGTKDINTLMRQIEISVRLHHIRQVILINHEDCGAYGKAGTEERHRKDLLKAEQKIHKKYPQLLISLYYLHLDGRFDKVE